MIKKYPSYLFKHQFIWVLLLCAGFLFYKYILQVYPSVITNQLMDEFKLTGAGLGNLAATFYYAYMIMQLLAGAMIDKWGTRNISVPAILCAALGMLLFSQSHTVWLAGVARAFMGAGVAFATVAYMKAAADWVPARHYAFVGGLLATAVMLGAVFGEAPLAFLISHWGWRHVLLCIGVLGISLAFFFWRVVREPARPEGVAFHKDFFTWPALLAVLKNKKNWMLTLYGGFAFSPLAVMGGLWGTPFIQESYGLTATSAAGLISLGFVGFGFGGPLLGLLSNYCGRWPVMFYSTLLSLVSLCAVIYIHALAPWLLGLLLFAFGFLIGAFMLVFAVGKESNPAFMTATVIAMINASDAVLDAITEPAIGKFLDWHSHGAMVNGIHFFTVQNYQFALSILPFFTLLSLGCLLILRKMNCC